MRAVRRPLAATVLTVLGLGLVAGCTSQPSESPEKPTVVTDKVSTLDEVDEIGYLTLTVDGNKPVKYLTFRPTKRQQGEVKIEGCSEAYEDGDCPGDNMTVLPKVDLQGWYTPLAAASTALTPKQHGFYRVTVKGADDPVEFEVRAVR